MDEKKTANPVPAKDSSPVSSAPAQPSVTPSASKKSGVSSLEPIKSAFDSKSPSTPMMQSFNSSKSGPSTAKVLIVLLLMAVLGVGTGYGLAVVTAKTGTSVVPKALNPNAPQKGKTYGSEDTSNYKDTAEGVLKDGGIEGEGQYHLERPGGDSQSVYLTSSTVDLAQFKGQKIKVWGQTQAAQKAGWLMDVGKVEVQ